MKNKRHKALKVGVDTYGCHKRDELKTTQADHQRKNYYKSSCFKGLSFNSLFANVLCLQSLLVVFGLQKAWIGEDCVTAAYQIPFTVHEKEA